MDVARRLRPGARHAEPRTQCLAKDAFGEMRAATVARAEDEDRGAAGAWNRAVMERLGARASTTARGPHAAQNGSPERPQDGATRYTQRWSNLPLRSAGPSERAGFIEAPLMGPANMASSAITAPIATPAVIPFSALRSKR